MKTKSLELRQGDTVPLTPEGDRKLRDLRDEQLALFAQQAIERRNPEMLAQIALTQNSATATRRVIEATQNLPFSGHTTAEVESVDRKHKTAVVMWPDVKLKIEPDDNVVHGSPRVLIKTGARKFGLDI